MSYTCGSVWRDFKLSRSQSGRVLRSPVRRRKSSGFQVPPGSCFRKNRDSDFFPRTEGKLWIGGLGYVLQRASLYYVDCTTAAMAQVGNEAGERACISRVHLHPPTRLDVHPPSRPRECPLESPEPVLGF